MTALPFVLISLASAGAAPKTVLIDFMSNSCGPCMQMSPVVEKLYEEGFPIRKVNVNEHPDLARQYGITMIPAFVLVVEGREVNRIVGFTTEGDLRRLLAQIPVQQQNVVDVDAASNYSTKSKATERKSRQKSSASVATVDEKKGKGFEIPFFKKKEQSPTVFNEREPAGDAVARANNDEAQRSRPADVRTASSVRIRVKDNGGINFGSGTVIGSRPGQSLILTCGHIFRSIEEGATIEVDVFQDKHTETFVGSVVKYDLEAEVGLVSIASKNVLPVARIASTESVLARGDQVSSVGCSGGEAPTTEALDVTDLNKYRGPDNVECTGLPVQGRSGGGLFSLKGDVVGVCFAADPKDERGLYAGVAPIHRLLDECELTSLYKSTAPGDAREHAAVAAASGNPDSALREATARTEFAEPREQRREDVETAQADEAIASADEMEEAEIVCIIRPLKRPQDASRVVIINRASSKFVRYLQGEVRNQPQQTMVRLVNANSGGESNLTCALERAVMRVAERPATDGDAVSHSDVPHIYRRSASSRGQ